MRHIFKEVKESWQKESSMEKEIKSISKYVVAKFLQEYLDSLGFTSCPANPEMGKENGIQGPVYKK